MSLPTCAFHAECAEVKRLRKEVRRIKGWLRWWNDGARDEHLFYMLSMNELRECLSGKPAPRKGGKP